MKKQILKIAGVKSEKEFYKKFPDEASFMAKHGKALKKAQIGDNIVGTPINLKPAPSTNYAWTNFDIQPLPVNPYQQSLPKIQTVGTPVQQENIVPIGKYEKKQSDFMKAVGKYAQPTGQIVQGIQQLSDEKKALRAAEQMRDVSAVVKQAASTRPEQTKRRYVRPEDIQNTGEAFFPIYGVGTNVLAKNGASVGGGEIMNTFAPNTLYDDLGYEPLNESERYKQFYYGGKMEVAQDGDWLSGTDVYDFASSGGGDAISKIFSGITGNNAGGNIGGTIGKTAGTALGGPVGGMIGQVAGNALGSLIDKNPKKTKRAQSEAMRNINAAALQQGIQGGQAQYTSFMKDGGTTSPYEWMSHTWQPQVITTFGEHRVKDLLTPPKDADMLRAGGHLKEYTPPSAAAMSTERPNFQMGGELQTHWGGYAEPVSYNPYMPGSGETVMFRGQSHDESDGKGNTGIGITYGSNPVEVERGEPMFEMQEGGEIDPVTGEPKKSGVVLGNIKITSGLADLLADPKAKGKKFKTYGSDLSKQEAKQNKLMENSVNEIDEMDVQTPFDRLKFNALQANVQGANSKLKTLAEKKMNAAFLQNAIHETKEEHPLEITDEGDVVAKFGKNIKKAQDGDNITSENARLLEDLFKKAQTSKSEKDVVAFQKTFHKIAPSIAKSVLVSEPLTRYGKSKGLTTKDLASNEDKMFGKRTERYISGLRDYLTRTQTKPVDLPEFVGASVAAKKKPVADVVKAEEKSTIPAPPVQKSKFPWQAILNEALPYVRPSNMENLDPNQLSGEMYALATNQLEPVQAQTFQPQLGVPYDISLQDILNENEATFRSQQRLMGYSPAAQAQLNAQKYQANQKVLGEQFRMNQAMKDQVYKENRNILNDANLKNLAILDQQYGRQAEAKSKTKATTQAALNSIASKYAQNKLENRTLATYENLYNYRFDPRFRALNVNPLVDFEGMIENATPSQVEEFKKKIETKVKKPEGKSGKNGSIVKALKNI